MKKTSKAKFRRRQEEKTNYKRRLALIKSNQTRITFRKSNKYIKVQAINYDPKGDKCIASATSKELKEIGWKANKNIPSAYLTGYLLGKKAIKQKVKKGIFDLGLITPVRKSKAFATLQGVIDSGIEIKMGEEAKVPEDRLKGKHIEDYAKTNEEKFSEYSKNGIDPKTLTNLFDKTKNAIDKKFSSSKVVE